MANSWTWLTSPAARRIRQYSGWFIGAVAFLKAITELPDTLRKAEPIIQTVGVFLLNIGIHLASIIGLSLAGFLLFTILGYKKDPVTKKDETDYTGALFVAISLAIFGDIRYGFIGSFQAFYDLIRWVVHKF